MTYTIDIFEKPDLQHRLVLAAVQKRIRIKGDIYGDYRFAAYSSFENMLEFHNNINSDIISFEKMIGHINNHIPVLKAHIEDVGKCFIDYNTKKVHFELFHIDFDGVEKLHKLINQ